MRKWVIFWASIALAGILAFVVRTQGYVSGEEFAPSHFVTREFSFYEIPVLHVQITPIRRVGTTKGAMPDIRQILLKTNMAGLIGAPADDQWHLVRLTRGLSGTTPADSGLLLDQLEQGYSNANFWSKWNVDHPKHAVVLWPIIRRLALRELYIFVPEILELAREDLTPAELGTKIDQLLVTEYQSLITDMRQAGRNDLADSLLKEALVDYPGDESLRALTENLNETSNDTTSNETLSGQS